MARILFGVMGDALGHVNQALCVAQEMPHHEFLFLGGGRVMELRAMGYPVEPIPMPATCYANNRVDLPATLFNAFKALTSLKQTLQRVACIISSYDPDLILTSYEFFVPNAARRLGRPCVSIDNQHFLTKCMYSPPVGQTLGRWMFGLPLRFLFSNADHYLINAFFQLPPKDPKETDVFPPLLRYKVRHLSPESGDHVLVYQTSSTFHRLPALLERLSNPVILYGFGKRPSTGNLVYKAPSNEGFLQDLASSRYVIANGGHNVIAEALFLGKPVLSFPIQWAYEQFFNAHMVAKQGYGAFCLDSDPRLSVLLDFEKGLNSFRHRIAGGNFCGNRLLISRLEAMIGNG